MGSRTTGKLKKHLESGKRPWPGVEYPPDDGSMRHWKWKMNFVCRKHKTTRRARPFSRPLCPICRQPMECLGWRGKMPRKEKM